jgi:hypothetical protein
VQTIQLISDHHREPVYNNRILTEPKEIGHTLDIVNELPDTLPYKADAHEEYVPYYLFQETS